MSEASAVQPTPPPPPVRAWGGLLVRRCRWGLSLRGWLLAALVALVAAGGALRGAYPFLSITRRVPARVLVVEGWIPQFGVRAGAAEFATGAYDYVVATGGPVPGSGVYTTEFDTSAHVVAQGLKAAGVPVARLKKVPAHYVGRDRTFASAVALRDWLAEHDPEVRAVNIVTAEAHARRTRLLFELGLGTAFRVGIISAPNPDYDSRYWWRYSEGVREVLGESIAYVYARCLFHPTAADAGGGTPAVH